ncbi:hypothetical protein EC973_009602 [Apophysomyces ossiformis]|uniref:Uncharacterized protein n=1 Tax=Apophysomyces ossiformis TaxID=679940 RepID=A0A8H7BG60_9FUNG|nr:hypothetical protein EC973_009602 [Apophysomyces ossiformis]
MPNVIFDDEASEYEKEWRRTRPYQVGWRAYQRSNYSTLQDDEPEPGYKDLNDYFGKVLIANVKRYEETYDDGFERMDASFGDVDEQMLAGLSVDAIVKLLDKAGIRYPIGQKVCQICKGTCNRILSGANRDRCKYDACVKFLGGYRGNEASPSCTKIPLP